MLRYKMLRNKKNNKRHVTPSGVMAVSHSIHCACTADFASTAARLVRMISYSSLSHIIVLFTVVVVSVRLFALYDAE
jgi:hypothetical protein